MQPQNDAIGQEIIDCYHKKDYTEIVERDDGFIGIGDARVYFQEYTKWPPYERQAIKLAQGTVLDIGCGAGRVVLYLQQQGHKTIGIDNSPLAIKTAKLRGAKNVKVLPIEEIETFKPGSIDTIIMYGNNFGLFGNANKTKKILATMHKITSPTATIIAATADPYATNNPDHLSYHERNRKRERMGGQLRIRIRHGKTIGNWFDYLLVSQREMIELVQSTDWQIDNIIESTGTAYIVILKKKSTTKN